MTDKFSFFTTSENQQTLRAAAAVLSALPNEDARKGVASALARVLKVIANTGLQFDEVCKLNIKWIGEQLVARLGEISAGTGLDSLELVTAFIYRIVLEYDLSFRGDVSLELSQFKNLVQNEYQTFNAESQGQIEFARRDMSLALLKEMLNSDGIKDLKNVDSVAERMRHEIDAWTGTLTRAEERVSNLQEALRKQEDTVNFVGLHEGFADLERPIAAELAKMRRNMLIFGAVMTLPSVLNAGLVLSGLVDISKNNLYAVGVGIFASITITVLLLYFFRIALRGAASCQAQLVQIRLRMSLCRFIQSYASYSEAIKAKNADALSKFEAIIFSGIVSTDDRLPSTFDGIDQLSGLMKSVKGG